MINTSLEKVEKFFTKYTLLRFKKGEILFRAGDNPSGVYYLHRGFVRQYAMTESGNETTMHIYGPGAFFPLTWAINNINNEYFFSSVTPCTIWRSPKEKLIAFLTQNPDLLWLIIKRILSGLDGLLKRIDLLSTGNAHTRVLAVFVYLAKHFGKKEGHRVTLPYRFTHHDISSIVGIARETTTREIECLIKHGYLTYDRRFFIINDINKLTKELSLKK